MIFLETLMEKIVAGKDLPKVQVERYISPILEIFIEDILTEYYKNDKKDENGKSLKGKYKLIAPEFPLQKYKNFDFIDKNGKYKKNYQSTNIDYLLLNTDTNKLIFLELKTDSSSFNEDQLKIYQNLQEFPPTLSKLKNDVLTIQKKSKKKSKYDYLLNLIDDDISTQEIEIIYLIPEMLKKDKKFVDACNNSSININRISFKDINKVYFSKNSKVYKFQKEWKIIKKQLQELNNN